MRSGCCPLWRFPLPPLNGAVVLRSCWPVGPLVTYYLNTIWGLLLPPALVTAITVCKCAYKFHQANHSVDKRVLTHIRLQANSYRRLVSRFWTGRQRLIYFRIAANLIFSISELLKNYLKLSATSGNCWKLRETYLEVSGTFKQFPGDGNFQPLVWTFYKIMWSRMKIMLYPTFQY